ncbi:peptidoglycan-binding protein [Aliivibrio sp. 1S165]|uniref:LysM peptidoglycan-binding domain-containing protein n=1 Tax=unclassified Aliivibrio TaxID=2645654 RepID=UPI00080DFDD5|nr:MULTISPECIES: LysM peptidoglycan-binding domain-containing protein [unclassified Aliivibrio]OCH12117.1 peptidoglycan-binding protein [Aliivibrio sp. 1S165]OCH36043.1 peptidoglycan-binding protein [Aliivibrio sp. 1S175]
MFKKIFIFTSFCSAIVFSSTSFSGEDKLVLKQDYPSNYTVKKGDTLWDISALFLDSPWFWPKLWQINPEINNPHLIYPGDKLSLTWLNGNPVLSVKPLKKLSPKTRTVVKEPVPTLPTSLVVPYLQSDRLIDADNYRESFRVLGTSDGRKFLSSNERVYVDAKLTHKEWGIYRTVNEFSRKDIKETAYALRLVGTAELAESTEDMSGLKVVKQQQEIAINDVVLPITSGEISKELTTTFYPQPAPKGMGVSILGSIDGGEYLAVNQVAVIDRGSNDGLFQGSMFSLKEEGYVVKGNKGEYYYDLDKGKNKNSHQLPQTQIGELIVIRPYETFSLALITRSEMPIHKGVIAVSPNKE